MIVGPSSRRLDVIVIVDGWPAQLTRELLADGQLPELSDWVSSSRSVVVDALAPFVSLSYPAHASLLTCSPPAEHRIPSHLWIERGTEQIFNIQTSSPSSASAAMSPRRATVFERLGGGVAINGLVTRGASRVERTLTKDPHSIVQRLVRSIRNAKAEGLFVCWLPGVDAVGHRVGPDADSFIESMRDTSRALESLFSSIEPLGGDARLMLASDHGLRASGTVIPPREMRALASRDGSGRVFVNPMRGHKIDPDTPALLTTGGSLLHAYMPAAISTDTLVAQAELAIRSGKIAFVILNSPEGRLVVSSEGTGPLQGGQNTMGAETSGRVPRFAERLSEGFVPGREPDALLVSADSHYFGAWLRPGYNWGRHKGTHGGPSRDESSAVTIGRTKTSPDGDLALHDVLPFFGFLPRNADDSDPRENQ